MDKAFIDTTILTDILLKLRDKKLIAQKAVAKFKISELPAYAIKEFKAGPLKNMAWFHNKFVATGSFFKALDALQRMALTPKRYTVATAIQALRDAAESTSAKFKTIADLEKKYGSTANIDRVLCDMYRLAIKTRITLAWRNRRKIATHSVLPLRCYTEADPYEEHGAIVVEPIRCHLQHDECCLAADLKGAPEALKTLIRVCESQSPTGEWRRRAAALKQLFRTPKRPMTENNCRNLGDAYFAFFAPSDSSILTTNVKDHKALAKSLGKNAISPDELP